MEPEDNDTVTITLGDSIYSSDNTFTIPDNDFFTFQADDSVTPTGDWVWTDLLDPPTIRIGNHVITEETVEKLQALLDVIDSLEDDNDLKSLFNTQLSLNKIRGEDENKSN